MKTMFSARLSPFLATVALLGATAMQGQSTGSQKTLTGVVSDSMCGVNHMAKNMFTYVREERDQVRLSGR
jgi:hypothetical protein